MSFRPSDHGFDPSAHPDAFAAAMTACQIYAPACADSGACVLEGECFETTHYGHAANLIERLAESEGRPTVKAGLKRAAILLRMELEEPPVPDSADA